MIPERRRPIIATTSLLPYRGVIVPDGLLDVSNAVVGRNIAKSLAEIYMEAKRAGRILKSM